MKFTQYAFGFLTAAVMLTTQMAKAQTAKQDSLQQKRAALEYAQKDTINLKKFQTDKKYRTDEIKHFAGKAGDTTYLKGKFGAAAYNMIKQAPDAEVSIKLQGLNNTKLDGYSPIQEVVTVTLGDKDHDMMAVTATITDGGREGLSSSRNGIFDADDGTKIVFDTYKVTTDPNADRTYTQRTSFTVQQSDGKHGSEFNMLSAKEAAKTSTGAVMSLDSNVVHAKIFRDPDDSAKVLMQSPSTRDDFSQAPQAKTQVLDRFNSTLDVAVRQFVENYMIVAKGYKVPESGQNTYMNMKLAGVEVAKPAPVAEPVIPVRFNPQFNEDGTYHRFTNTKDERARQEKMAKDYAAFLAGSSESTQRPQTLGRPPGKLHNAQPNSKAKGHKPGVHH